MKKFLRALVVVIGSFSAAAAWSQTMTFEGLQNNEPINEFYNGGAGGFGSTGGTNLGVSFVNALALIDNDAGGTGNVANEPSPSTVLFFTTSPAIMNVAAGFSTGFAFKYTSAVVTTVTVFDGLNGSGNILATLPLAAQHDANGCTGDPNGTFCNWTEVGVPFAGTAKSVSFSGVVNAAAIEDITINSAVVGGGGSKTLPENIACASDLIKQLQPGQVVGIGQRNLMDLLLGNVLRYQANFPSLALNMLNLVIARTDGCPLRTAPDTVANQGGAGMDYVTSCAAQGPIYACLNDARTQLLQPNNN